MGDLQIRHRFGRGSTLLPAISENSESL